MFSCWVYTLDNRYSTPLSEIVSGLNRWREIQIIVGHRNTLCDPSNIFQCNHVFFLTRYVPGSKNIKWQEFGVQASVQGKCCGPFQSTYGGKHGRGSQHCGSYMFSEIQAATDLQYFYDQSTQTAIGYMPWNSTDGWTEAGTWFSYSDKNSVQAITQFISQYIIVTHTTNLTYNALDPKAIKLCIKQLLMHKQFCLKGKKLYG